MKIEKVSTADAEELLALCLFALLLYYIAWIIFLQVFFINFFFIDQILHPAYPSRARRSSSPSRSYHTIHQTYSRCYENAQPA